MGILLLSAVACESKKDNGTGTSRLGSVSQSSGISSSTGSGVGSTTTDLGSNTGYEEPIIEEQAVVTEESEEETAQNDAIREDLGLDESDLQAVKSAQEGYYCYSVMDESLHDLYAELYVIIMDEAEDVKISTVDSNELKYVFQCLYNDHPEIYWIDGYSYVRHEKNGEIQYLTFTGKYTYTKDERDSFENGINAYVNCCIGGVDSNASEYEKVKYVYEYIAEHTEYVTSASDNQNILSVFLHGESVCQGYAKAMQYILYEMGIQSAIVTGKAYTGEGHAWNLVNIDDAYYYVDVTWGDSDYVINGVDATGEMPLNYDFLNITTEELERTHTIDNIVPMPACISTINNYYVKEGIYFTDYDVLQISSAFGKAYGQGDSVVTLKCADETAFQAMYDELITNQAIFDYIQASTESVTYTISEDTLVFNFWI